MRRGVLAMVFSALLVAACADSPAGCARLGPAGPAWCLLAPASAPPFQVLSEVILRHSGRQETLLVLVENDVQTLRAAVLSPLGQRLALVRLTEGRIDSERAGPSGDPELGALLAMIQLTRWPLASLVPALREQALELLEVNGERRVRDAKGRLLASADCAEGRCRIALPEFELSLELRDLPPAELPR